MAAAYCFHARECSVCIVRAMDEPLEPPVIKKLDFSEFPWDFQWRDRVRKRTLCLAGRHHWVAWFRGGVPVGTTCLACDKEKDV